MPSRVADALVPASPAGAPSAAAVGIWEAGGDPVTVVRGHAQTLDEVGRPLPRPAPLAEDPVFDVGSVTKIAAATALCMTAVDKGLRLESPVARWFSAFAGEGKETLNVRDLLEHQAGLWEWWPTYLDGARTAEDALALVQALPLRRPPRTGRHYSDLGFMLLGEIVARENGQALDVAARRQIFEPLQMKDTGFRQRGEAIPTRGVVATSVGDWYERRMVDSGSPYPVPLAGESFTGWRTHTLVGEANDGNCWHAFNGVAGHAGLFTTAADLLRLGRGLLASLDGHGLWSPDVVREFCRPGRDAVQGLGFRVRSGGSVVEHPGFPGAHFAVLPERQRVAVLLTNRLHTTGEPATVDSAWNELVEATEAA